MAQLEQRQKQQHRAPSPTKTKEIDTPKGTTLILGFYALLIGILWGLMYFDLILRS